MFGRQYILATIDVSARHVREFVVLVDKTMSIFTRRGWHLELQLRLDRDVWAITQAGASQVAAPRTVEFVHLWQVPDMNSLLAVMDAAADDPTYVQLDDIVAREQQISAVALPYDPAYMSQSYRPPMDMQAYMIEYLDLDRSPGDRNQLHVDMNTALIDMRKNYDWNLLAAGNCTTGTINRYFHVWGTDATDRRHEAQEYYRHGDALWSRQYRKTVRSWRQTWWEPRDFAGD